MSKKKFEEKCQEIFAFEDEIYAKVCDFIKPYAEELKAFDYEMTCEKSWTIRNKYDEPESFPHRVSIKKYHPYACHICVIIEEKKINNSLSEEEPEALQLADCVTSYHPSLFGWFFHKYDCEFIFNNLAKYVVLVKTKGVVEVLKELYGEL